MFFIGNCKMIVLWDSKNRAISDLITCIFHSKGLFPSEFQPWNRIANSVYRVATTSLRAG